MENNNKTQISTPVAIIVAGFLVMVGILLTKTNVSVPAKSKTLSEQIGISKEKMAACIKDTNIDELNKTIDESVNKAMAANGRGTPYSVVIGVGGVKTDIRGAESYEKIKAIVDDAILGKVSKPYSGEIVLSEPNDHSQGNVNAKVTIVEYSDYECPYCKQFHPVLERIVKESEGNVRWIYRHFPLHQHSFEKLVAANCVAKIKGEDAFWKYSDLLFGLLKTTNDTVSDQL
jgi:thiol-disulfide isomerase/thioredoxin